MREANGFVINFMDSTWNRSRKPPRYHHAFMKRYLLLAAFLILVGCGKPEPSNREVLAKLEAMKSELAARRGDTVRWAFANKREIDSAIFQWSRDRMEEVRKSEALPAETEEKIRQYEALQAQLMHREMEARGLRLPPRVSALQVPVADESISSLSNRVAAAKAPIADILERRSRQASQYREQYPTDKLVAEYAKDRFDLVVDSSDERTSRSAVLYRTNGEVLDITDGVIKIFKEKVK